MLISLPLLAPNDNFKPEFVAHGLELLSGVYPVGPGQMWHGGCHLRCPASKTHDVRAIADGVVVGFRVPTEKPADAAKAAEHPLNYGGGWSDDGFVLLKHEKESGEGVPVVFYSLYMHLSRLNTDLLIGKGKDGKDQAGKVTKNGTIRVSRKEKIGELGRIYGQADTMHFEIFADEDSLTKFFKQTSVGDGAMKLWGDVHFVIPEGTPYTLATPKPGKPVDVPHKTGQKLLVTLGYDKGARVLKTYRATGEQIDEFVEADAEYQLYKRAQQWLPKHTSAGYELLRFGRAFGPDALPDEAPDWQLVPIGHGLRGWIDLNTKDIQKLSDADFPEWLWRPVTENEELFNVADSKCEAAELIKIFDADGDGLLAPLELNFALSDAAIQQRARSLVCRFPSEWDYADDDAVEKKLGWVKQYFQNPAQREKELAEKQKAWISKVTAATIPRLASLDKELLEAKDGKANTEAHLADLKKEKAEAEKADKASQAEVTKTKAALKAVLKKKKKATAEARAKAEDEAKSAKEAAEQTKKALAENSAAIKTTTDSIATITREIGVIEAQIKAARTTLERETNSLAEADKAIAEATKKMEQPAKDPEKAWERFTKHVLALKWWDGLTGTCCLADSTVWHFHPLAFIEHFRKCHWFSKEELSIAYSKEICEKDEAEHTKKLEFYRVALNQVFYKYGVITPIRIAHYLGQGAVESDFLHLMQEKAMTPKKIENGNAYGAHIDKISLHPEYELGHWYGSAEGEKNEWFCYNMYSSKGKRIASSYSWRNGNCGDVDALKFRGRGFKQLTGLTNYSGYWVYRAWLDSSSFDRSWDNDPEYKQKNLSGMKKCPPVINDPHRITVNPYNCIDIGGWYLTFQRSTVLRTIDGDEDSVVGSDAEGENMRTVTLAINGGEMDLEKRKKYTRYVKRVLL